VRFLDVYRVSRYFVAVIALDVRRFLGRKEILDGILGANLVCFQVSDIVLVLMSARADYMVMLF
jgi:hypothetical protein